MSTKKHFDIYGNIEIKQWFKEINNIRDNYISVKKIVKITEKAICICLQDNYENDYRNNFNVPLKSLNFTYRYCTDISIIVLGFLWIPKSAIKNIDDIIISQILKDFHGNKISNVNQIKLSEYKEGIN